MNKGFLVCAFGFLLLVFCASAMAHESAATPAPPDSKVYIVYMDKTTTGEQTPDPDVLESQQLDLLASVLGSPQAAKEAVLYHYKHSVHGFSAKLTPEQVARISVLPGVIQVTESRTHQLHAGVSSVQGGVL